MPKISKKSKQKSPPPSPAAKPAVTQVKEVLYPDLEVREYRGDGAITVTLMKEILGWQEETEDDQFGSQYALLDRNQKKIRLTRNATNRPIYKSTVVTLVQEHLKRRWRFNGEPIIIGKCGSVLNGQHCGISLILAAQDWAGKDKEHWRQFWDSEPTMEKLVVLGIDEDDATVNTLDVNKRRTAMDVMYRSAYFADKPPRERKKLAAILDYAVRLLWRRTGVGDAPFAPKRTHAEIGDFVAQHPRVLDAVRHIYEEDQQGAVSQWVPAGYAAGLLYLMAAAQSDQERYAAAEPRSESDLNMSLWDEACDFWVSLIARTAVLQKARDRIALLDGLPGGETRGEYSERIAIVAKAWQRYADGGDVTAEDLDLDYYTHPDGSRELIECPTVGGVDVQSPEIIRKRRALEGAGYDSADADSELSPEELEQRAQEARLETERLASERKLRRNEKQRHDRATKRNEAAAMKTEAEAAGEMVDRTLEGYRIVSESGAWNVYHSSQETDRPLSSFRTEPQAEEWVRKDQERTKRREQMKEKLLKNRKDGKAKKDQLKEIGPEAGEVGGKEIEVEE